MSLPQASTQKETYFVIKKKMLQDFKGHDHWYCRHIAFGIIYKSQSG